MSSERFLITGGGGQLASDLEALLGASAEVVAPGRAELDITNDDAVAAALENVRPTLVFNCAAFHNVEVCEREEERALAVNVRAVKRLAQGCEEHGARLVHLSTNYVFDGSREAPYEEHDLPAPRSVYALSKLSGEHAAVAYCSEALVVRTAGLYGLHGSASKGGNFVTRMIDRAREQRSLKMVADQRLNPTFTGDLAQGLVEAVECGTGGVLHLTNSGACSWFEFTEAIMELAGIDVPIEPVPTTRPAGGADRPLNGVLASSVAPQAGLSPLRPWRDALASYMEHAGLLATAAV